MENNEPSKPDQGKPTEENRYSTGDDAELEQLLRDHAAGKARYEASNPPKHRPLRDVVRRAVSRVPAPAPQLSDEEIARRERVREQAARQREACERLRTLIEARGERYALCTLQNYRAETPEQNAALASLSEFSESMRELVLREGQGGLILYGPRGTGKDHLLMALMRYAVFHAGLTVKWCNGMDLLGDIRDRIQTGEKESSLIRSMSAPNILAISDPLPPFGSLTEFQATMLFRVIDARYSRRRPIWITVNVANRAELEQRMGAQLVDRLIDGALVTFCNWPSYRKVRKRP